MTCHRGTMLLTSWDAAGPLPTRALAAIGLASNDLIRAQGGRTMGLDDKVANAAEHAKGTAKEAAGKATDNERLEAEGRLVVRRLAGRLLGGALGVLCGVGDLVVESHG